MLRWGAPATEDFELEDEQPASQAVEETPRLEAAEVAAVSEDQLAHISGAWTKCLWWICVIIFHHFLCCIIHFITFYFGDSGLYVIGGCIWWWCLSQKVVWKPFNIRFCWTCRYISFDHGPALGNHSAGEVPCFGRCCKFHVAPSAAKWRH